jgi:hypothetical protein
MGSRKFDSQHAQAEGGVDDGYLHNVIVRRTGFNLSEMTERQPCGHGEVEMAIGYINVASFCLISHCTALATHSTKTESQKADVCFLWGLKPSLGSTHGESAFCSRPREAC